MGAGGQLDVLIVSLGSTMGLRTADQALADSIERAGASVAIAAAGEQRQVRTMALTDLLWARAARGAAKRALSGAAGAPRAIIYSSTTAALFWPRAGAIRFDAPAAGNRAGRDGLWQRPLERRRLAEAPLLLPLSRGGLEEVPAEARAGGRALVLGLAAEASGPPAAQRDIAAITYAANPRKKGLDRVLEAWRALRRAPGAPERGELVVAGASAKELSAAGIAIESESGVRSVGRLDPLEYRALLRRSRVFVCAPRREDYGAAQLEALADGCMLASTTAPGPYVALEIARRLDGRLIDDDLACALRSALDDPQAGYAERAKSELEPFSRAAIDERVARELLPRLLP